MTVQVNVYDAKTNLSKLIDRALAGERIVIARAGRPVVDLVVHVGAPVVIGGLKEHIHYDEDAFDAADADIAAMYKDTAFDLSADDAPA